MGCVMARAGPAGERFPWRRRRDATRAFGSVGRSGSAQVRTTVADAYHGQRLVRAGAAWAREPGARVGGALREAVTHTKRRSSRPSSRCRTRGKGSSPAARASGSGRYVTIHRACSPRPASPAPSSIRGRVSDWLAQLRIAVIIRRDLARIDSGRAVQWIWPAGHDHRAISYLPSVTSPRGVCARVSIWLAQLRIAVIIRRDIEPHRALRAGRPDSPAPWRRRRTG